tara:strand:- start:547 stop:834 length:288 start_codon:yes stop_codon:yes gene_type:complete
MIIYVDIDGTICHTNGTDYNDSKPKYDQIYKINKLYDEGNVIVYWTARGTVTQIDWTVLTRNQLNEWGVKYHDVRVGKPQYDLWIDDKSKTIELL